MIGNSDIAGRGSLARAHRPRSKRASVHAQRLGIDGSAGTVLRKQDPRSRRTSGLPRRSAATRQSQTRLTHFNQAVSDWEAYARSATSQYNPQLFSRTHYLDWWKILEDVKKEARSVQEEETKPKRPTSRTAGSDTKGLSK